MGKLMGKPCRSWMQTKPRFSTWQPVSRKPRVDSYDISPVKGRLLYFDVLHTILSQMLLGRHSDEFRGLGRGHIRILVDEEQQKFRYWFESEETIRGNQVYHNRDPLIWALVLDYDPRVEVVWYASNIKKTYYFGSKTNVGFGDTQNWATTKEVKHAVERQTFVDVCEKERNDTPEEVQTRGKRREAARQRKRRVRLRKRHAVTHELLPVRSENTEFLELLARIKDEMNEKNVCMYRKK